MENHQHRFYCHLEAAGTWGVWDRVTDSPASLGGRDLLGCTSQRATVAEGVLTKIYDGGLDALSLRILGRPPGAIQPARVRDNGPASLQ